MYPLAWNRQEGSDNLAKLVSNTVRLPAQPGRRARLRPHLVEEEVVASSRPTVLGPGDKWPRIRIMRWSTGGDPSAQSVAQLGGDEQKTSQRGRECRENPRDLRRQEGWDAAVAAESGHSSVVRAPLRD